MAAHKGIVSIPRPSYGWSSRVLHTQEQRQQTGLGVERSVRSVRTPRCQVIEKKQLEHTTTVDISILCRLDSPWISHSVTATRALRPLHMKEGAEAPVNGQHTNMVPQVNLHFTVTNFYCHFSLLPMFLPI